MKKIVENYEYEKKNPGWNCVKIGEIFLESKKNTVYRLLQLAIGALKNPEVKNYLNKIEKKKSQGMYVG